jgi:hypothetical protein
MQGAQPTKAAATTLFLVKVVHTLVWAIFVACILVISLAA